MQSEIESVLSDTLSRFMAFMQKSSTFWVIKSEYSLMGKSGPVIKRGKTATKKEEDEIKRLVNIS